MNLKNDLLSDFLGAKTGAEIQAILRRLGDFPDEVILYQTFGEDHLCWVPVGDRATNVATIELATDSVRSIVERAQNAFDAQVEARLRDLKPSSPPSSPTEAAMLCFNRPAKADALAKWFSDVEPATEAALLSIVMQDGSSRDQPRIDVFDSGTGIPADKFSETILSLNKGNKLKIVYSLGIFGQGGSSSLAFASFILIVSRSSENPAEVGFTLIRRCQIRGWRECCYAYLVRSTLDGAFVTLRSEMPRTEPLALYPSSKSAAKDAKLPKLLQGTVVRHFDYRLPHAANELSSSQRNLYHALQYLLPDPILPFRLTDCRDGQIDSRHMSGARNRLRKLAQENRKANSSGTELKHHHGPELIAPPNSDDPCIAVEWWVVFSWRKTERGLELRSGTEQFCDRDHPIQFLYNGQSHGELTGEALKRLGLNLLRRHMVVYIDVSNVDANTKRELFVSTRESLRKSATRELIIARMMQLMAEDHRLFELEQELAARALASTSDTTSNEIKDKVIRMLKDRGIQVGTRPIYRRRRGVSGAHGNGGARPKLPPLPSKPFPEVTTLEIVSPVDGTTAYLAESKNIRIETDAADAFDEQGLLKIECEPKLLLELTHKTPLNGGRAAWRFYPHPTAQIGDTGKLHVSISVPSQGGPKEVLRQSVSFEIAAARREQEEIVEVPDIEVLPIDPQDVRSHELWASLWPDIDPGSKAAQNVAYKLLRNGAMRVMYNVRFDPYQVHAKKAAAQHAEALKLYDSEYRVYIAFHSVLQSVQQRDESIDPEVLERITEQERAVTATLIATHVGVLLNMRQKGWEEPK